MIVTFHLAVYFVYYIWNNYVSGPLSDNESNTESSSNPKSNDNNKTNPTIGSGSNAPCDRPSSGNLNSSPRSAQDTDINNSNNVSENSNINSQTPNSKQGKEGKGDYHPCLPQISILSDNEDEGRDSIYNVEPEYTCVCSGKKIQFFPPVYTQRYMEIERMLKKPDWVQTIKKVVDFGCAELSFEMKYLKKLHTIEEIVSVDIDLEILERNCCKVAPVPTDYLKKRPTPLLVRVFCGSVAHTHDSLTGVDAVIAIELIEHLFPPELECLPFTIFGFIRPKIAIFTTPNADFNVLFPGMSGFRHPDHKFEWSQQQFKDWSHNLVQRYPDYQVKFKGVGPGPPGSEKLGCCSQMATFVRINESSSISKDEIHLQDGPYTLVREYDFPYFKDERTEEEKASDDAEWFLTSCKMRTRVYDKTLNEIPIKAVMERIEYHDKENLKRLLMARSWEVKLNSSDEEVVVFHDSEEERDSEPESNEYITDNVYIGETNNLPVSEEDWDSVEVVDADLKSDIELCNNQISPHSGDHSCVADYSYHSVCTTVVNSKSEIVYSTESEKINSDKLKCSTSETNVPDIEFSDKLYASKIESIPEKDTNLNFEQSIYETPYNNGLSNSLRSKCDCSLPLSDEKVKGCKRALIMESPNGFTQCEADSQSEDPFFCLSGVSSSCDTSIYATPCCSQRHKTSIPKCLSLQQISRHCSSPVFNTELDETLTEGRLVREHTDKLSKSMEGFRSLESDLTYNSTSKVVDSGYPDSCSEFNMDMDLTPGQIADIETENEEDDASSRSLSPPPPPPQFPWLMDDVRNGDVANNNRDGEGNNLVADMEEDELEFEARIDEINNEVMNLAAANDEINFGCNSKSNEADQESSGDHCLPCLSDPPSLSDMAKGHLCSSENLPSGDLLRLRSVFTEKNTDILFDLLDKQSLRGTKSDTSISTNYSWILESPESQTTEEVNNHDKHQTPKLKTHNSLTTILDGYSKFSNCSLVRPVEVYQVTGEENNSPSGFSKSVSNGSREQIEQGGTPAVHATTSSVGYQLQDDRQSLLSVYQSAESLNSHELQTQDPTETCLFPDWLLNILISDVGENEVESIDSVQSVWDSDSLEERMELNYDVQVDARGGGDPQRDTWH